MVISSFAVSTGKKKYPAGCGDLSFQFRLFSKIKTTVIHSSQVPLKFLFSIVGKSFSFPSDVFMRSLLVDANLAFPALWSSQSTLKINVLKIGFRRSLLFPAQMNLLPEKFFWSAPNHFSTDYFRSEINAKNTCWRTVASHSMPYRLGPSTNFFSLYLCVMKYTLPQALYFLLSMFNRGWTFVCTERFPSSFSILNPAWNNMVSRIWFIRSNAKNS